MYAPTQHTVKPLTIANLATMKREGEKIACLTAYDASFARVEDQAGVDVVLVGDSLGMVVQGLETTVPVSMDDIIYHSRCVARGLQRTFLLVDMPFLSYATLDMAVTNAMRLMQEGGAKMIKLEGNAEQANIVEYLSNRGVPVCAHLGLTPQSIHKIGGYRVQGRAADAAAAMKQDAQILEAAGADMLLLECVPTALAAEIAANANVPVIGIGAGAEVDGQILVLHDILGVSGHTPKFAKNFLQQHGDIAAATQAYVQAVKQGVYPDAEHTFV